MESVAVWPAGIRAAVSLTFDDGRGSQVRHAVPLLDALGVHATFYVTPAAVAGRVDAWRAVARSGHEIGNHTVFHPCSACFPWCTEHVLEEYDSARMEAEILEANARLEALLGVVPTTFAYPCGQSFVGRGRARRSYVPTVAEHFLAGRGFRDEHLNPPGRWDLAKLAGTDLDMRTLEDAAAWVDRACEEGSWLVFVAHDVGCGGLVRQAVHRDVLRDLIAYCLEPARGVWVDTVEAIARRVTERLGRGTGRDVSG